MSLRQSFLLALAENEDDATTRLVYADWLEENDEYDEADRQRKWPAAKQWLADLVAEHLAIHGESRGFTYAELIEFGRAVAAMENTSVEMGSHHLLGGYYIAAAISEKIPEFWRNWSIVTGLPLPAGVDQKYYYVSGYCCAHVVYPDTHLAGPIPEEVRRAEEERVREEQQREEEYRRLEEEERERSLQERAESAEELRQLGFDRITDELEEDRP